MANTLSKDLHTKVSVKHVDFGLFDKILMEGTLVLDHNNDTLLYAGTLKARVTDWFFLKNDIKIKYAGLDNAIINLRRRDSTWNYQFLVDYFSGSSGPPDTTQKPVQVSLRKVELNNVKIWQEDGWIGQNVLLSLHQLDFTADTFDLNKRIINVKSVILDHPVYAEYDYRGNRPEDTTSFAPSPPDTTEGLQWNSGNWKMRINRIQITNGGISVENQSNDRPVNGEFDPNDIVLSGLDATLQHVSFLEDTISAAVDLSVSDRGGFRIKKLIADYRFTPDIMEFKKLDIVTNHSHITNYYSMRYNDFNDDMGDYINSVRMEGHFTNCTISSDDIAYFAPEIANWHENFILNADAKGTVSNLVARNIILKGGANNYINGEISMRGLPDLTQTFIDFRTKESRTNYNELTRLVPDLKTIQNPNLAAFGNIEFSGSYTGFVRDFVTYGSLKTDIGALIMDLQMKIPEKGRPLYNGSITTPDFQVGTFIGNDHLGKIAFNGKVNGKGFNANDVDIAIDGNISSLNFNGYDYANIIAHGNFVNRLFSGSASMDDPNLRIDTLSGSINFSKKDLQLRLDAEVPRLNAKNLGWTNDSISLTGNFKLNFTGNTIDNFLGSAKIYNAILLDNEKHLSFDSLEIISSLVDSNKILTVETNEMDASIKGDFKIIELPQVFQIFLNKYFPSYVAKPSQEVENQNFSFQIKTRNVSDYISLINHRFSGLDNSSFSGKINLADNIFSLNGEIPQFSYKKINFNEIQITGLGNRDTLGFSMNIGDVVINDSLHAPSTVLTLIAHNDNSEIRIRTSANKTLNAADLAVNINTNKNGFKLLFNPSSFTINNKKWTIEKGGTLELDKNMLMAQGVRFNYDGQEVSISTTPSSIGMSNDILINITKLDIGDFAPLFIKDPGLKGLMNGNVRINDPYGKPVIDFKTDTHQFFLNNDSIGNLNVNGEYVVKSGILTSNFSADNKQYDFSGKFRYASIDTSSNQLSGDLILNHSQIHFLNNYLVGIFSDVTGTARGELHLSGTTSNTSLTGKVNLDDAALTVDYTKCRYRIQDNSLISFNPDEIDLGNLTIEDTLGNTATVTGKIYHNFFDNFFFNEVHFVTDPKGNAPAKFLLLNTTAKDNSDFYGKVIGEAEMSLNGFSTDLRMDISGEPTDSSIIYLPTAETAETGSLDYIEFAKLGQEMQSDLSAKQTSNIKVNMSLTANPYAKIFVILDEATGDIIRAQGNGKLNITGGTVDPTTIRGRYDIEQGRYTFNFQTISKTQFILQQGYIEWQGDPYLANLNIDAVYTAQGVDLSTIPTSAGFTNTKGDVDVIFKLRGTLADPRPEFEFEFPFGNPLKTDPIANEYLKNFQTDPNDLNRQVTSLLLFNSFMSNQQGLLSGSSTSSFVARSVGQILSATLTSSLNNWVQQLFKTNSVNLYTNVNTTDFNFIKGNTPKEIQNVGAFGFRTAFLKNRLQVKFGGNVDYRLAQATTNSNANFLLSPDVSFEYLISPDGRFRIIGFNRSDADLGDISGITRRNRTGIQLSYRKESNTLKGFFINEKKRKAKLLKSASESASK